MNLILRLLTGIAVICHATSALGQEGDTYPHRASYFMFDINSISGGAYAFDYFDNNNQLTLPSATTLVQDRHHYINAALHATNVSSRQDMSRGAASYIPITENGFSVAFWTKFPYPVNNPETETPVLTMESNGTILWQCGLVEDGRAYVRRYTAHANGNNHLWSVKFWEPFWGNIGKYVAEHGADNWFFIMLVQEKGQMRLHVGMPDGKFDCMYLDYGLDDQTTFNNNIAHANRKISLFPGNGQDLYLDDLALWTLPLCRTEAFEYFKDQWEPAYKPGDDKYTFYNSSEKTIVHTDDNQRMLAVQRGAGDCMTSLPQAVVATPEALAAVMPEKNMQNLNRQKVTVYPNPASDRITIDFGDAGTQNANVHAQLYDMAGRLVAQKQFERVKGQRTIVWEHIRQSRIPTGIYVLKCVSGGMQYSAKIMIDCSCGN